MKKLATVLFTLLLSLALCASALAYTYHQDFKMNDYHEDIKLVQKRLTELQYLSGKADGWFGAKTRSAIRRFQLVSDLEETGVADQPTLTALFAEDAKKSPAVLMSLDRLKELMSTSGKLGVKYDLSDMVMDKTTGTVELNNYVVMHCELLGDEVTELSLIGKDNVKIPFTMLLMALDSSIDTSGMYDALNRMIEDQQRVVNGMQIVYQKDGDGTERLIVTSVDAE